MRENIDVIRIGTSPMTPGQFLLELWPKIQEKCPNVKFQLIPFGLFHSPTPSPSVKRFLDAVQNVY